MFINIEKLRKNYGNLDLIHNIVSGAKLYDNFIFTVQKLPLQAGMIKKNGIKIALIPYNFFPNIKISKRID